MDSTKFLDYDLSKWPKVKAWLYKVIDEDQTNLEASRIRREYGAAALKRHKL